MSTARRSAWEPPPSRSSRAASLPRAAGCALRHACASPASSSFPLDRPARRAALASALAPSGPPSRRAVNVKWGKAKFDNLELDPSEPALLFKTQLFALTGVPVERMKVMGLKGGPLKDDATFDGLGLKPGQTLLMMGTSDAVPEPPKESTTFIEDMPTAASVEALSAPAGLRNLGNTCYLNSSLQVRPAPPALPTSIRAEPGAPPSPVHSRPPTSLRPTPEPAPQPPTAAPPGRRALRSCARSRSSRPRSPPTRPPPPPSPAPRSSSPSAS